MKYFCFGIGICLKRIVETGRWKVLQEEVTHKKARKAFDESDHFILCKTLTEACEFRKANVLFDKDKHTKEDYNEIPYDYAIYEIEVNDSIELKFNQLRKMSWDEVEEMVRSEGLKGNVLYCNKVRYTVPDIEVCYMSKDLLKPKLIKCHFTSIETEAEIPLEEKIPLETEEDILNTSQYMRM